MDTKGEEKINKKEIYLNRKKTLEQIKRSSLSGTQVGRAKCWKGVKKGHWITMCDVVWKLVNDYDFEVFTEVEFLNGSRADIFYLDSNGNGGVVEVLDTESDERFNVKLDKYPFSITKVRVKDYSEDWCL